MTINKNDTYVNMLKTVSSIWLDHMRELSLYSNKIIILLLFNLKKKKYTYQTHRYVFFNIF